MVCAIVFTGDCLFGYQITMMSAFGGMLSIAWINALTFDIISMRGPLVLGVAGKITRAAQQRMAVL
jgi:hypothetical protein